MAKWDALVLSELLLREESTSAPIARAPTAAAPIATAPVTTARREILEPIAACMVLGNACIDLSPCRVN